MVTIHELECIEYRVLDVVCAQHVLCVLCVGVVKDTVAQIYLQVSLKLILPATGGGVQEAATHLDSSSAAGLCIVSVLYAAVFCSIPSR